MLKILLAILCTINCYPENVKTHKNLNDKSIIKNSVRGAKIFRKYVKTKQYQKSYLKPILSPFHFDVSEFKTQKGINVRFIQIKNSNIISISYAFKNAGNISEKKLGTNDCLIQLMTNSDGKNLTNNEIKKLSNINSICISINSSQDDFIGNVNFPQNQSNKAIMIMNEVLYNLDFKNSFNLVINQLVSDYLLCSSSPDFIIKKTAMNAMFPNHRYGKIPSNDDFKKLSMKDVEIAYKNLFSKNSLLVVVVGNISKENAAKIVDDIFGKLPEKCDYPIISDKISPKNFKNIKLTKENYNTNKILFALNIAPHISDPEYIPIKIALQIFSSIPLDNRLINNLRKKIGQVYYASFGINNLRSSAYFAGFTESTNMDVVIKSIYNIIEDFQTSGITEYEFYLAKNRIKANLIFSTLSTTSISSILLLNWLDGRDKDYINNIFKILDNVTFEETQSAIKKFFSTNNLNIVTLSNKTK